MDLLLEIISYQRHSMSAEKIQFTFKASGGTIGRNSSCDWFIDDPERLVSGSHAVISFENKQFYIKDISTNGLFVNQKSIPQGNEIHPIINGDCFTIGQYQIQASLIVDQNHAVYSTIANNSAPSVAGVHQSANVAILPERHIQQLDPLASFNEGSVPGRTAEQDILASQDPLVNAVLNPVPSTQSYFELPDAIPEDWHNSTADFNQSERNNSVLHEPHSEQLSAQESASKNEIITNQNTRVGTFDDFKKDFNSVSNTPEVSQLNVSGISAASSIPLKTTLNSVQNSPERYNSPEHNHELNTHYEQILKIIFDTLNIKPDEVAKDRIPQLITNIAQISKQSMMGIMQVMNARAYLKNEFRMDRTTIKTEQNNPLKFCINYEQLVHYMLTHPVPGYLDSEQSVKESFCDIQEHQIAVMSGMKSALMYMLNKLSPDKIQQRSDKILSLTLSNKKTRYWDAYKELYEDVMSEEDIFNHMFGNEFCRAYEQQINDLHEVRKEPSVEK